MHILDNHPVRTNPILTDSDEKLLSGAQAAEFLGVKAATLYAYASRGLIESIPGETGRERAYKLSDLVRLRNSNRGVKNSKDPDQATWTGPLIKSSITEITAEGHSYRGQDTLQLAQENKPFENVAELLWDTADGSTGAGASSEWARCRPYSIPKQFRKSVAPESDYLDVVKLILVLVEMTEAVSPRLLSDEVFLSARRLIVTMAEAAGIIHENEPAAANGKYFIAQTLLSALSGTKSSEKAQAINCALVLCADHELNASALASRIAASCDAPLFSCLLSALGTFSGSFHGAASRRAEDFVSASMKFKSAASWLKDHLKHNDGVPGFGSEIYSAGDPRANLLIETAQNISSNKNKNLLRLIEMVECVRDNLSLEPNLDVGLAAISYALSLPPRSGTTIFAVSRAAGWIAHAIEQRLYGGTIRPRAKYIGKA